MQEVYYYDYGNGAMYNPYDLPVDPDESYTVNLNVYLGNGGGELPEIPGHSGGLVGSGYFIFATDSGNSQNEINETDNTYSVPFTISVPNLIITDVTAPTTAGAGQSITLSWTGKNDSPVAATSSYWYWFDQVVFSTNNIYGDSDDIYLTQQLIYSSDGLPLEPNETYTVSSTVTLPSYVAGSGYLLDLLRNSGIMGKKQ